MWVAGVNVMIRISEVFINHAWARPSKLTLRGYFRLSWGGWSKYGDRSSLGSAIEKVHYLKSPYEHYKKTGAI